MKIQLCAALFGATMLATSAAAVSGQTVVQVTPGNMQGWQDVVTEQGGGGHAEITGNAYDGDGSVAAHGDRDRFVLGGAVGLYGNPNTDGHINDLGVLADFANLSFSYMIDPSSTSALNPLYGPALRIVFYQGTVKDELVFEQVYQAGGYGAAAPKGSWNVTSGASTFYLKSNNNENVQMTMAQWIAANADRAAARVGGIYVGVGSGTGSGTFVHFDDIIAGSTEYKFDLTDPTATAAVPESATWAMMIGGFGLVGGAARRSRRTVALAA